MALCNQNGLQARGTLGIADSQETVPTGVFLLILVSFMGSAKHSEPPWPSAVPSVSSRHPLVSQPQELPHSRTMTSKPLLSPAVWETEALSHVCGISIFKAWVSNSLCRRLPQSAL